MKKIILTATLLFAVCAFAAKAPQYRSMRVHGMGNAFIAVADNKDALYYNPAGLNLIGRLGNFERNPDMGYMPRSGSAFSFLNVTLELPVGEINDFLDVCGNNKKEFWSAFRGLFFFDFNRFSSIEFCEEPREEYRNDDYETMGDRFLRLDGRPLVRMRQQVKVLEYARHNFGISAWANTSVISPYVDFGIFIPYVGYDTITADIAAQAAFAFSPADKWSFGVGVKGVQRYLLPSKKIIISYEGNNPFNPDAYLDAMRELTDELIDDLEKFIDYKNLAKYSKYNLAMDFGALYQVTREARLGVSLRDVYFSKLAEQSITPNLSFGAMASPMLLQSNSWFGRKVNFAVDYVDVLNENLSDMPLSHLNFGAELEQVFVPSPTKDMSFWPQTLFGIVGGLVGGGVGYFIGRNYLNSHEVGPFFVGSLIGIGSGYLVGSDFGGGNDLLRVSAGSGFSGGYWSATAAMRISLLGIRYTTYAEEMGTRTGQKGNRYHTIEFGSAF
ncbi:MAG: hypothetical protein LBC85_07685 [Fibromonadaceae bacterium]|jgi:hypothetical protein|nr:hypothetical protein [Fibromonadaceae bacterium]